MTKGILIDADVMILRTGSGCVGAMSWETPFVEFLTPHNGVVRWQSDYAESWMGTKPETIVHLRGFIYGPALNQTLRRVTVTKTAESGLYHRNVREIAPFTKAEHDEMMNKYGKRR